VEIRDTRYARARDGAYIAYQTVGEGPIDLVWQFDFYSNVDVMWENPLWETLFHALAGFSRVILHDRRGTGLSSRNVPAPNLETRVGDLLSVLDLVRADRPVLAGKYEGGSPNLLLAATHPDRVHSVVWRHPEARCVAAPDYPWGVDRAYLEADRSAFEVWGTNEYGQAFAETEALVGHEIRDEVSIRHVSKLSRHTATPDVAVQLWRIWQETDIRGILGSVIAPTLLVAETGNEQETEYIAERMSSAAVKIEPDTRGPVEFAELVRGFTGVSKPAASADSVLSTILFTDIVGSTQRQAAMGDHAWKGLIEHHHSLVRETLRRYRGTENDTTGDGFFATFDGPARAIRCAQEIAEQVRAIGLEVRAGIHTGECELIDDKVGGLAVTIGARVCALAGPSEVLVSQTVRDLVAGSGLSFEDAGEHELKGVPDTWHLYRVVG
jgi:class 3 adenylate cyclase/pimeloyl-ACP methyl ester carboxylesterase